MKFEGALDSGSAVSLMNVRLAKGLNLEIRYGRENLECANETKLHVLGNATMSFFLGRKCITHNFYLTEKLKFSCIVGQDIIKPYGIIMNSLRDEFFYDECPMEKYPLLDGCQKLIFLIQPQANYESLPIDEHEMKVQNLITEFPTVCRTDGKIGQTDLIVHKIELTDYNKTFKEKPRMLVGEEWAAVDKQCKELLKEGLIRRSNSPFGFNVVLDKKSDGGYRMTVNYKKLNEITIKNATPMQNANVILKLLPVGGVFSKIDLKSGFWQIRMYESSIPFTAFYGNGVLYEFRVLPFGLVNAPATLMNMVIGDFICKFTFIYMDDVIVFSKDKDKHLEHLRMIFERLREANLSVNLKKCSFLKKSIEYLGHIVTEEGVKANPEKVRAVMEMPEPTSKKELSSLNGLCNYLSNFIPHLSTLVYPITKIMKKNAFFHWGNEQRKALDAVRKVLSQDLMLKGIDFDYSLYLRSDASDKGMGIILCQEIDGKERVVAYASKKFKDSELHLSAVEKECKAILFGLKRFSEFIGGQKIICYTDNKALTYLKSYHPNNRNLTRWSHIIEGHGCEIKYFEGKKNVLADVLSRFPVDNLVDEPDQLEDCPEKSYVPCLAITYFSNVLEKIKLEQEKDVKIQEIVSSLSISLRNTDIRANGQTHVIKDGILYKCVLPFDGDPTDTTLAIVNSNVTTNIDTKNVDGNFCKPPTAISPPTGMTGPLLDEASHFNFEGNSGPLSGVANRGKDLSSLKGLVQNSTEETRNLGEQRGPLGDDVVAEKNKNSGKVETNLTFIIVPVVPQSLKYEIMEYFHSSPEFGHFGRKKTIYSIKRRFYWDFMNKEIADFVKRCTTCQKIKGENMKRKGLMGKVPVAERVFETIYMDFVGPMVPSKYKRNRFLFVLVDQLSGWVEMSAMPNATAKRVTDFLEDKFCQFGSPKAIITDNGSNFTGKIMKQFCKERSIKHVLTSAYHACANRCERSNKDIVRMIASFVEGKHDLWDLYLQQFALALRSTINETTGVSPALLMLGREISLPIDRSLSPDLSVDYEKDAKEIAQNTPNALKELIQEVRKNISHKQDLNKIYHDQIRRNYDFKEGQFVWVRNNQLSDSSAKISKKFCDKWIGPYKIVRKRELTYYLAMPKQYVDKRHVSDLKPYYEPLPKPEKQVLSVRKIVTNEEPEFPKKHRLRPRKPVCYSLKK